MSRPFDIQGCFDPAFARGFGGHSTPLQPKSFVARLLAEPVAKAIRSKLRPIASNRPPLPPPETHVFKTIRDPEIKADVHRVDGRAGPHDG